MERLTDKNKKCIALTAENSIRWAAIYAKLKKYEDMEENGLLVQLPCKIGDVVCKAYKHPQWLEDIMDDSGEWDGYSIVKKYFEYSDIEELGKTVFLTKAEAEAKLKEMEGENADSN